METRRATFTGPRTIRFITEDIRHRKVISNNTDSGYADAPGANTYAKLRAIPVMLPERLLYA